MNRTDYILTRKANGDARTVADIGAEFDALSASLAPPPPDQAALTAAVERSNAVNAALVALAKSDPARFESLRRESFDDQAVALKL